MFNSVLFISKVEFGDVGYILWEMDSAFLAYKEISDCSDHSTKNKYSFYPKSIKTQLTTVFKKKNNTIHINNFIQ